VYILGINCYGHDASAALIKDGAVLALIEEERLSREKHTWKFPINAIRKCLEMEGIEIHQIEKFTYFYKPWVEFANDLLHFIKYLPKSLDLITVALNEGELKFFKRHWLQHTIGRTLQKEFNLSKRPSVAYVEHHLAHAASAFFVSEFEEAAILTFDGRGEKTTTLMAHGKGHKIKKLQETFMPHSLGYLYSAITHYLGFKPFFDEWKVMGMSAYGKDFFCAEFEKIINLKGQGQYELDMDYFRFHTSGNTKWVSDYFISKFGPPRKPHEPLELRHYDVAFALQRSVEKAGVYIAKHLYDLTGLEALCMTGGVALNVLMNNKIMAETPFKKFFVQPIASDAGTSMGSALYYYHQVLGKERKVQFDSAYLGPEFTDGEIESALITAGVKFRRSENIARDAAQAIFEGKITGWFQGRMEAGPRALGNRSIVVNPMDKNMKERLNARVKKRETFRPFAPSILEESVLDFFELPKEQLSPYMILAGQVKAGKGDLIPAVTHADNTARVHTVNKKTNPLYWQLIHEFEKCSGVPVLLNTSFNENEPIVCTPGDAIRCFQRTEFDVLAIGDFMVTKDHS
jgi:carbamoyltransferase